MMDCKQAKSLFSTYLDGAVTGRQMRAIAAHLEGCGSCHTSYYSLRRTQAMLSSLPTRKAPADLALRINVAIQRERANNLRFTLQRIVVRLENALNAFMLPATAGLVTAVVMFGILIGFFAVQVPQGNNNDVPTLLYTPPRLASGPYDIQGLEGPVLIDASVDPTGRVDDYEILSGHDSEALRVKIDNALIFTQFEPARAFGAPASGHVVLAFSSVNVKG